MKHPVADAQCRSMLDRAGIGALPRSTGRHPIEVLTAERVARSDTAASGRVRQAAARVRANEVGLRSFGGMAYTALTQPLGDLLEQMADALDQVDRAGFGLEDQVQMLPEWAALIRLADAVLAGSW